MLTTRKERKFLESIELQIGLRDYDPERDKRFSGSIRLPFTPHPFLKVLYTPLHNFNFYRSVLLVQLLNVMMPEKQVTEPRKNLEKESVKKAKKKA